ncbi:MAG: Nucleotidyltransferase domain protein [Candidatus Bathyarchaeota archaeon BA2]|nr:MAG: Nucleotidyltransferase domain protein [Candidatus Bathyarchaeota archaeon BA2]
MHLEERHISDLNKIVDKLSKIQGVIGVFLFGSIARGDHDAYSDYDLLVLFEDKALMWQNWNELFQTVGNLKMHLHVIPQTLEELKTANPVFLKELLTHGKVLFAKFPLEVFPKPAKLKPFCLIIYDMSCLSYKDKMKAVYFLYKKEGTGTVTKVGGIKLNEGCLLVPSNVCDDIIDKLSAIGVNVKKLEVYVDENYLSARRLL